MPSSGRSLLAVALSLLSLVSHAVGAPVSIQERGYNGGPFVLRAQNVLIDGPDPGFVEFTRSPNPTNLVPVYGRIDATTFTLNGGVLTDSGSGEVLVLNNNQLGMRQGGGTGGLYIDGQSHLIANLGNGNVRWQVCGDGGYSYLSYNDLNCRDVRLVAISASDTGSGGGGLIYPPF